MILSVSKEVRGMHFIGSGNKFCKHEFVAATYVNITAGEPYELEREVLERTGVYSATVVSEK